MKDLSIVDNYMDEREFRNYVQVLLIDRGYKSVTIDDVRLSDDTKLNDNELVRELKESKEMLSKILGKDVTEICLPIGYFTEHLLCKLREFEYKEVYSSIPGNYAEPVHGWMRCRHLCQFATPTDVKFILHGGNDMISSHYEKMHNKS